MLCMPSPHGILVVGSFEELFVEFTQDPGANTKEGSSMSSISLESGRQEISWSDELLLQRRALSCHRRIHKGLLSCSFPLWQQGC